MHIAGAMQRSLLVAMPNIHEESEGKEEKEGKEVESIDKDTESKASERKPSVNGKSSHSSANRRERSDKSDETSKSSNAGLSKDGEKSSKAKPDAFKKALCRNLENLLAKYQPAMVLREQGFQTLCLLLEKMVDFKPNDYCGAYGITMDFFHLGTRDKDIIPNHKISTLHCVETILRLLSDGCKYPNIVSMLSSRHVLDLLLVILRSFLKHHRAEVSSKKKSSRDHQTLTNAATYHSNMDDHSRHRDEESSRLFLTICSLALSIISKVFIEWNRSGFMRYDSAVMEILLKVFKLMCEKYWGKDPSFATKHTLFRSTSEHMDSESLCPLNELLKKENPAGNSQTAIESIYDSLTLTFSFTLCRRNPSDGVVAEEERVVGRCEIEAFLDVITSQPVYSLPGLCALHQVMVIVTIFGLEKAWKSRLNANPCLQRLKLLRNLTLAGDAAIHQIIPCLFVQFSHFGLEITRAILQPFLDVVISHFLCGQLRANSSNIANRPLIPVSKFQLIRFCRILSWILRDAWTVTLAPPSFLTKLGVTLDDDSLAIPDNKFLQRLVGDTESDRRFREKVRSKSVKDEKSLGGNVRRQRPPKTARGHLDDDGLAGVPANPQKQSTFAREYRKTLRYDPLKRPHIYLKYLMGNGKKETNSKETREKWKTWVLDPRGIRVYYLREMGFLSKILPYFSPNDEEVMVACGDVIQASMVIPPIANESEDYRLLLPSKRHIVQLLWHLERLLKGVNLQPSKPTMDKWTWGFCICALQIYSKALRCLRVLEKSAALKMFFRCISGNLMNNIGNALQDSLRELDVPMENSEATEEFVGSPAFEALLTLLWFFTQLCGDGKTEVGWIKSKVSFDENYKEQLAEISGYLEKCNQLGVAKQISHVLKAFSVSICEEERKDITEEKEEARLPVGNLSENYGKAMSLPRVSSISEPYKVRPFPFF